MRRSSKPLATLALGLALLPCAARAQDSDADGVGDVADAFPCDAARASVSYFPGQSTSALLAFEDQWPGHTDVDYNDVAVRVHYRLERNAAGNVVSLVAVVDPVALGGDLSNGLGLVLPAPRTGVTARRRIGGGAWQGVTLEGDASATMVLSSNLRELYGNASGRINSRANEARQGGQRLELEVTFATPAAISQAAAPFDVFVFRAGNLGHQIHFPQYGGTAAMNAALFNSDQDASSANRRFVHVSGVPAALNLMTTTRYPLEGVGISALFPDIAGFAASGGASNVAFYSTSVVSAQGHDVAALALPAVASPSVACIVANPATCAAILAAQPSAPSGVYTIDVDGSGPLAAFAASCDMSFDGGGWTLYLNTEGRTGPGSTVEGEVHDGLNRRLATGVMQALAARSREVHLRQVDSSPLQFITSNPDNAVIANVRQGLIFNQGLPGDSAAAYFRGTRALSTYLAYSCPTSGGYPTLYWACGNTGGAHFSGSQSRWTYDGGSNAGNFDIQAYLR